MQRRDLLKATLAVTMPAPALTGCVIATPSVTRQRVRPGDPDWPSDDTWAGLGNRLKGTLARGVPGFAACTPSSGSAGAAACAARLAELGNPWAVGDDPSLTETSGWIDAWRSQPAAWVMEAGDTADVALAIDFARTHRLRLVVRGGGHSYQGTSDAPDSLLVHTRHLNAIELIDAFVPAGAPAGTAPQPAVRVEAGGTWADVYDAVTTRGGRYAQGGGCTSVGVAGFVQGGGFGNFSKRWGTGASNALEFEVVTADGRVRMASAHQEPDLFWALKGGGGGTFGIVTRLVLRTHALPATFSAVFGQLRATDDVAWRALVTRALRWCGDALANEHWGEQIKLEGERELGLSLVCQGLEREQIQAVVAPLVDWARAQPGIEIVKPVQVLSLPARHFWDANAVSAAAPGVVTRDSRPAAPRHHAAWTGDLGQVGWFIHGYQSAWLPQGLLSPTRLPELVDALIAAKDRWDVALHLNKALGGAPSETLAAARDTATNPEVLDAFALAIIAGGGPPAFPGQPGAEAGLAEGRRHASTIASAAAALRRCAPNAGAYVSESDFFQPDWQRAFWGPHAARLERIKAVVDPDGLFVVHHGVGSTRWSDDGFTRLD